MIVVGSETQRLQTGQPIGQWFGLTGHSPGQVGLEIVQVEPFCRSFGSIDGIFESDRLIELERRLLLLFLLEEEEETGTL
jgi:hypothetical protein